MDEFRLRTMTADDRWEVADLICVAMNEYFRLNRRPDRFSDGPMGAEVYFDVYESLEPGCGIVAEHTRTGRLMGSCFLHDRETHVSLGITGVHPNYFGSGVARALIQHIIDYAERHDKPVRLVSSAINLDSFSLYTRLGFVPNRAYQDMFLPVPAAGLDFRTPASDRVREATLADVEAMAAVEMALSGIRRTIDYRYMIENREGFWHVSVCEAEGGGLDGFMASCGHCGCNLIGPGVARTEDQAAALMLAELNRHRGRRPVFLAPVDCGALVRQAYQWGARNCEMHFSSTRGPSAPCAESTCPVSCRRRRSADLAAQKEDR